MGKNNLTTIQNRISSLEHKLCLAGSGDHILKPSGIPAGWIAQVDATGNDIEWVPPVAAQQNAQLSLTGGQSVYTLPSVPVDPASSILVYENHTLMYGIGYTISGTQLTFLTDVDWQIEPGEKMHIVYS